MKIYIFLITFILCGPHFSYAQYDLESCETNIDTNIPEFYQKYFQCIDARLSQSGNYINLYFNGTPPYDSWYWSPSHPNYIDFVSQGEGYFQIPGSQILSFDYVISVPVNPGSGIWQSRNVEINADLVDGEVGTSDFEYPMGSVGSALNGVSMFNPCAAPPDVIEDEAFTFDYYKGHPAGPSGIYHYHTNSNGPLEVLAYKGIISNLDTSSGVGSAEIELFGIMCDGVVVMGCTELDGGDVESSALPLDAQNGHVHDMVDENGDLMLENRYHTHICYDEYTEEDTDGDGFQQHEFTPEISYYKTPNMGESYNRCATMTEPFEEDMVSNDLIDITPIEFSLFQNYPNPFNPLTTITYDLPEDAHVNLTIYDMLGNVVKYLTNKNQNSGFKSIQWNATDNKGLPVSGGVYLYTIRAGDFVDSKKMIFLK